VLAVNRRPLHAHRCAVVLRGPAHRRPDHCACCEWSAATIYDIVGNDVGFVGFSKREPTFGINLSPCLDESPVGLQCCITVGSKPMRRSAFAKFHFLD